MRNYKVLQMTNKTIGAVAIDGLMPYGIITRKICQGKTNGGTFSVTTTGADTIYLQEAGNYRISYSGSLVAGATGDIAVSLIANGVSVYTVTQTVTAVGDVINLTLPYEVRVCPNSCAVPTNCPMSIQIQLTGVAITDGTSNILVEKVY